MRNLFVSIFSTFLAKIALAVILCLLLREPTFASEPVLVGREAEITVTIPGNAVAPKPADRKAAVMLRVEKSQPTPDGFSYQIRYIGLKPGQYDLMQYLQREDGQALENLPPVPVQFRALLPDGDIGALQNVNDQPLRWLGSYRALLIALTVLWALLLIPILFFRRIKPTLVLLTPLPTPPTLPERLRPLLGEAAKLDLDTTKQLELQNLTYGALREHFKIAPELSAAQGLAALHAMPEAHGILIELDAWFHSPARTDSASVESLLERCGRLL